MSVPAELSLFRQNDQYRIRFRPVRELWDHFRLRHKIPADDSGLILPLTGKPILVEIIWKPGQKKTVIFGKTRISAGTGNGRMLLLADHGIIEYWADDGLIYGAAEADPDILSGRMEIHSATESIQVSEYTDDKGGL